MSAYLIDQYRQKHEQTARYGGGPGPAELEKIRAALEEAGDLGAKTVIDYGCGHSHLVTQLFPEARTITRYDPALDGLDVLPLLKHDLLLSTDVLEHIPAEELSDLFAIMRSLAARFFFTVHMGPAYHHLPDGQNCHATVRPREWWLEKLELAFGPMDESPGLRGATRFFWGPAKD